MSCIRYSEAEGEALLKRMASKRKPEKIPEPSPQPRQGPSLIELRFAQQITEAGLPEPVREFWHIKGRDFRLDFAWPDQRVGLEVQGMAHRVKGRFKADIEKRALGLLAGWRVLEVGGKEVRDGKAIEWLKTLLQAPQTIKVTDL